VICQATWKRERTANNRRYSVFRRVVNYYSDDPSGMSDTGEDAFDMRKPCSRDKKLEHVRENGEEFRVGPEDVM
jgi:N-terminal acetyltransferase B complex catalytic subunit